MPHAKRTAQQVPPDRRAVRCLSVGRDEVECTDVGSGREPHVVECDAGAGRHDAQATRRGPRAARQSQARAAEPQLLGRIGQGAPLFSSYQAWTLPVMWKLHPEK